MNFNDKLCGDQHPDYVTVKCTIQYGHMGEHGAYLGDEILYWDDGPKRVGPNAIPPPLNIK